MDPKDDCPCAGCVIKRARMAEQEAVLQKALADGVLRTQQVIREHWDKNLSSALTAARAHPVFQANPTQGTCVAVETCASGAAEAAFKAGFATALDTLHAMRKQDNMLAEVADIPAHERS